MKTYKHGYAIIATALENMRELLKGNMRITRTVDSDLECSAKEAANFLPQC